MLWTTVKHVQQQQRGPGCRHALSCLPTWCASRVGRRSLSLQTEERIRTVVLGGRASTAEGDMNVFFSGKLATNLLDVSLVEWQTPLSPPFQKACPFGEWNGKFCFCSWFAQFLLVKTTPKQASRLHTPTGVKQKPVQPAIRGDGCNFASWLLAGGRGCLVFPDVFSGESKIVGHGISTTHLERSTVDVVVRDWIIVGPLSSATWSVSIVVPFACEHGQVRSEPLSCAEARDSLRFLLQPSSPLRAITWSSSVDCQGQTPLLQMSRTGLAQRPDHQEPAPPPAPNKAECDGKKRGARRVGLGGSSPPAQVGEGLVLRRLARTGWRGGGQDFFFLFSPWLLQCCGTCIGHGRRNWRHGVIVCRQSPLGAALAPRSSGGAISLAVFLTGPHPAAGKGDPSGNWINAIRRGELAIRSGPPSSLSSVCWLAVCLSTLILSQSVTARGTAGNGDSPRAIRFKTRSGIARDIAGVGVVSEVGVPGLWAAVLVGDELSSELPPPKARQARPRSLLEPPRRHADRR